MIKFYWVKKKKDSEGWFAGKWHIPGETVETEESDQEALVRGMREEAGIEIRVEGGYIAHHISPKETDVRWYICYPLSYNIRPGSDLSEVKWVSRSEVPTICSNSHLWPDEIKKYFGIQY